MNICDVPWGHHTPNKSYKIKIIIYGKSAFLFLKKYLFEFDR